MKLSLVKNEDRKYHCPLLEEQTREVVEQLIEDQPQKYFELVTNYEMVVLTRYRDHHFYGAGAMDGFLIGITLMHNFHLHLYELEKSKGVPLTEGEKKEAQLSFFKTGLPIIREEMLVRRDKEDDEHLLEGEAEMLEINKKYPKEPVE